LAKKAGHDINFVALSGLLPTISGKCHSSHSFWPPANLLGDCAGGGLLSAFGVVSALLKRTQNGRTIVFCIIIIFQEGKVVYWTVQ
jgi:alpha-methylacyl-CoA racemase